MLVETGQRSEGPPWSNRVIPFWGISCSGRRVFRRQRDGGEMHPGFSRQYGETFGREGRGEKPWHSGALLRISTNLSQAFIWWKAWIHTEYTPSTELCQLVVFVFFPWHFLRWLRGLFFATLRTFFDKQTYRPNKYLIRAPSSFKAQRAQTIQRAPCLAWNVQSRVKRAGTKSTACCRCSNEIGSSVCQRRDFLPPCLLSYAVYDIWTR